MIYELRYYEEDAAACRGKTADNSLRYRLTRRLEQTVLERATRVTTISEALRADLVSRGEKFDLILCDVILSHGSGIELYEFLRAEAPEQLGALVFMTGGALTSEAGQMIEQGKLRVVLKPLRVEELRSLAADAVEASASRSERESG